MSTVGELRAVLSSKGYQQTLSTPAQQAIVVLISAHTHPLLNSPVILIGADNATALEYQQNSVDAATQRR